MKTLMDFLVGLVQLAIYGLGLFSVVAFGIRQILGLVRRQTELSELDNKIKQSLRERVDEEVARRERDKKEAETKIQVTLDEMEDMKTELGEKTDALDDVIAFAGCAIIAADFGVRFGSHRLKQLVEQERALIKGLPDRIKDAMIPAMVSIASATSREEKAKTILDAATRIADAYGAAVLEAIKLGRETRFLASLAASVVPLAVRESSHASRNTTAGELLRRVFERMRKGEMPVDPLGEQHLPLLTEGSAEPSS